MFQTSINLGTKRNSFYDSTDSDSSSSDDDDDEPGDDTKPKKGRLLKQSFLAKKVTQPSPWDLSTELITSTNCLAQMSWGLGGRNTMLYVMFGCLEGIV